MVTKGSLIRERFMCTGCTKNFNYIQFHSRRDINPSVNSDILTNSYLIVKEIQEEIKHPESNYIEVVCNNLTTKLPFHYFCNNI